MIEVEIKLPLYRRSITERSLRECGFAAEHLVRESDFYFTSDFHDFMKTDEALRIRTCDNLTTRKSVSFLTYKGKKLDAVSMTREELETEVKDADTVREILAALGYRELSPVTKLRQYYHRGEITACVDQVAGLGSFLELEILTDSPDKRPEALRFLENVLKEIGSSLSETTTTSYLSMLLGRRDGAGADYDTAAKEEEQHL